MAKKKATFKNEYIIDMAKLDKQPINYTLNGILLPIEKINDTVVTEAPKLTKLFAERQTEHMIKQYPILFPMINRDARTIIEYITKDGQAVITLFPNSEIDIHNKNWQEHLSKEALEDLVATYNKRKNAFESARGALHAVSQK